MIQPNVEESDDPTCGAAYLGLTVGGVPPCSVERPEARAFAMSVGTRLRGGGLELED